MLVNFHPLLRELGLTLGYLRHVYGAKFVRKPSYGFETSTFIGSYDALHIDLIGALSELAVAMSLPGFVSLHTEQDFCWYAFTPAKEVPAIDFKGDTCFGVFGSHHDGAHLILQDDDPDEIEHVLVSVSIDGWQAWIHGSTLGVDLQDSRLVEQGRRFQRYEGHVPRAIRQAELYPWCFRTGTDPKALEENLRLELQPYLLPEDIEQLNIAVQATGPALFTYHFFNGLQGLR